MRAAQLAIFFGNLAIKQVQYYGGDDTDDYHGDDGEVNTGIA